MCQALPTVAQSNFVLNDRSSLIPAYFCLPILHVDHPSERVRKKGLLWGTRLSFVNAVALSVLDVMPYTTNADAKI